MVKRKATKQMGRRQKRQRVARVARPLSNANTIYRIKRTIDYSVVNSFTSETAVPYVRCGFQQYTVSDVPSVAEFCNLFQQMRITGIELNFFPRVNTNNLTAGLENRLSLFSYAITPGLKGPPASLDALLQLGNAKTVNTQYSGGFKVKLNPRVNQAEAVASGALTGIGVGSANQWLIATVANAATAHYGFQFAWQCNYPSQVGMDCRATYMLEFKGLA